MSTDLLSQLEEYFSQVSETQEPIHPDEVAALAPPVREMQAPSSLSPRRGWLVAVAAAAAVLVIGLLSLMTRQTAPEDPVLSQPSTPIDESDLVWTRVPYDGVVFGGAEMISVTVGGPGLVAVGSDGSDEDGDAAVWTSPDGVSWSRVPHDEVVFGGEGAQRMTSVTAGGPGLVAVGWREYYHAQHVSLSAAVWTSSDGITWSQVPHDESILGGVPRDVGGTRMSSVTAGGPGLVAVGWWGHDSAEAAVLWTSPDGITWSQVPHDETAFGGAVVSSVAAGGPGLVAVGESDLVPGVWTSVDGIKWARIPQDRDAFEIGTNELLSVANGDSGLVAVGGVGGGPLAPVWASVDGIEWTRLRDEESTFPYFFTSVMSSDSGFVAVGQFSETVEADGMGSGTWVDHPAVWTSTDGQHWNRNVLPGGGDMVSVAATESGYVAVGHDAGAVAVWVANK